MSSFNQEENSEIPSYLSHLEETVLEELSSREKNFSFRFNGLRRVLNDVHQQKLSRALERLQEDHLIERFPDGGYGLGKDSYEKIKERFKKKALYQRSRTHTLSEPVIYSARATDKEFPVKSIINRLIGKYFGQYRFMGHYFFNKSGKLEWINAENQSKIIVTEITPHKITILGYNTSKVALDRFLQIIQQILLELQLIVNLRQEANHQVN
ncbi:MAG: hypothetical protein ACTSR2_12880 [Candidatus Hodarchaeales archaeon]